MEAPLYNLPSIRFRLILGLGSTEGLKIGIRGKCLFVWSIETGCDNVGINLSTIPLIPNVSRGLKFSLADMIFLSCGKLS